MNPLSAPGLNEACQAEGLPWRVAVVAETASTNDSLREQAAAGAAAGCVLFAEAQTAGRGRRDNRWLAPPGQDLMFSLLLRPQAAVYLWPRVTTLAALAVCLAIEDQLPLRPLIKWPNDIYLDGRKVSGLLAEVAGAADALVLGIGLNVNTRTFPPGLEGVATSLLAALPAPGVRWLDRQALAVALLRELDRQLQRIDEGFAEAVDEVRRRSWLLGRQIRALVAGREVFGRVLDLNAEGHLLLALPDGSSLALASADSVRQVV